MDNKNKEKILKITSDKTGRPGGVSIKLVDSNGVDSDHLGLVQKATWEVSVGDLAANCVIETIMTPVELELFAKNVEFKITVLNPEVE
jgi:hypothetical protein